MSQPSRNADAFVARKIKKETRGKKKKKRNMTAHPKDRLN